MVKAVHANNVKLHKLPLSCLGGTLKGEGQLCLSTMFNFGGTSERSFYKVTLHS